MSSLSGPDGPAQGPGPSKDRAPKKKDAERRCIATGETQPKAGLLRFAIGPEGEIGPDLAERLPGRGLWVTGTRAALEQAIARKAFARAAKRQVVVPDDLPALVERLLAARAAETLGLARRAGELVLGLERVFETLDREPVAAVIEASDAGRDGARRLRAKLKAADLLDLPIVTGLDAAQMGLALGRANVVHAALKKGRMEDKVLADFARLTAWGDEADRAR
ncbi:MAG: RNA-binding protein [Parvibaculaceae bacterium]